MRAEGSRLCSSGGERWGGGKDQHPQTANHHNKANPTTATTSPLVATYNSPRRIPSPLAQGSSPGFSHGEKAMPSEGSHFCFGGGEQWGG
ncbi:MAG: hypothetical protein GY832_27670 [Chloroflexi bacterium]|nr:hypothetical protein [Chloroflexota bacterium]